MSSKREQPAAVLPTDQFEQAMARLIGLPNGAHTAPAVVQDTDFYGNTSQFIVQTFKHDQGETTFLTVITPGAQQTQRLVLTPKVLATIDRQRGSTQTMVRRRHGRRIAEERKARGEQPAFMRAKAPAQDTVNFEASMRGALDVLKQRQRAANKRASKKR